MSEHTGDEAELRAAVGRLRDLRAAMEGAAADLETRPLVTLAAIADPIREAFGALGTRDLDTDAPTVRMQLGAFLGRLKGLREHHPGLVPARDLGLPGDARFLRDMAGFLTQRYGLDEDV